MKVILLKDIPSVGRRFDVKDVADGHALNFLLPQNMAETATEKALARLEKMKATHVETGKVKEDLLFKNIKSLDGVTVTITRPANEKGHLFAGIDAHQIVEAIKDQTQVDVAPEFISHEKGSLEKPIKEVGEHKITVSVREKSAVFTLMVNGEEK